MRKAVLTLAAATLAGGLIAAGCLAADPIQPGGVPAYNSDPKRAPAVRVMPSDHYVFVLQPAKGMPPMLAPTLTTLQTHGVVAVPVTVAADRAATARAVEREVSRLIGAGTLTGHITVVGWGTGGDHLVAVAERINNGDVGYVLIDGCTDPRIGFRQPLKGRFLSLAIPKPEGSGQSCRSTFAARGAANDFSFDEVWVKPSPDGNADVPRLMIAEAINAWAHQNGDDSDFDPR